jgi:peptidoglycan/LPS O-acetylase OafA/YrhL
MVGALVIVVCIIVLVVIIAVVVWKLIETSLNQDYWTSMLT